MGLDVIDWITVILIIICALSILAFAVGYLWAVAHKCYLTRANDRSVRMNNEIWLKHLFTPNCYRITSIIEEHPEDFLEWIIKLPDEDYEECVVHLETYINLLNTCSVLEVRGVIPKDLFWNKLGPHLKAIAACKELYSSLIQEEKQKGLGAKLLEME